MQEEGSTFILARFCYFSCSSGSNFRPIWHWFLSLVYLIRITAALIKLTHFSNSSGITDALVKLTYFSNSGGSLKKGLVVLKSCWAPAFSIASTSLKYIYIVYIFTMHIENVHGISCYWIKHNPYYFANPLNLVESVWK